MESTVIDSRIYVVDLNNTSEIQFVVPKCRTCLEEHRSAAEETLLLR